MPRTCFQRQFSFSTLYLLTVLTSLSTQSSPSLPSVLHPFTEEIRDGQTTHSRSNVVRCRLPATLPTNGRQLSFTGMAASCTLTPVRRFHGHSRSIQRSLNSASIVFPILCSCWPDKRQMCTRPRHDPQSRGDAEFLQLEHETTDTLFGFGHGGTHVMSFLSTSLFNFLYSSVSGS